MSFKSCFLTETLSTVLAGIRLLSSVNSHVGSKASSMSDNHSTPRACVRPFSRVNSIVPFKSWRAETFSALLAGIRLLSCVF